MRMERTVVAIILRCFGSLQRNPKRRTSKRSTGSVRPAIV